MAAGKKTGGRTKGTPNFATKNMKDRVNYFTEEHFGEFVESWKNLEDKEKVEAYIKLIKFVVPTCQKIEMTDGEGNNVVSDFISRLKTQKIK